MKGLDALFVLARTPALDSQGVALQRNLQVFQFHAGHFRGNHHFVGFLKDVQRRVDIGVHPASVLVRIRVGQFVQALADTLEFQPGVPESGPVGKTNKCHRLPP